MDTRDAAQWTRTGRGLAQAADGGGLDAADASKQRFFSRRQARPRHPRRRRCRPRREPPSTRIIPSTAVRPRLRGRLQAVRSQSCHVASAKAIVARVESGVCRLSLARLRRSDKDASSVLHTLGARTSALPTVLCTLSSADRMGIGRCGCRGGPSQKWWDRPSACRGTRRDWPSPHPRQLGRLPRSAPPRGVLAPRGIPRGPRAANWHVKAASADEISS